MQLLSSISSPVVCAHLRTDKLDKKNKKKRVELKSINSTLFLKLDAGNVLSSQEVALQVFSPLQVFTTVFGMGTGGLPTIGHQQTCHLLLVFYLRLQLVR